MEIYSKRDNADRNQGEVGAGDASGQVVQGQKRERHSEKRSKKCASRGERHCPCIVHSGAHLAPSTTKGEIHGKSSKATLRRIKFTGIAPTFLEAASKNWTDPVQHRTVARATKVPVVNMGFLFLTDS